MRAPWQASLCKSINVPGKPREFILHLALPAFNDQLWEIQGHEKTVVLHARLQPPQLPAKAARFMGTPGEQL